MDKATAAETRQRVLNLIEETGGLLGMIPQLLDENEHLRSTSEANARDNEALRNEMAALRAELQQFRVERDEMAETFTRVMNEMVDLMNQILPKLKPGQPPRRSPFERDSQPAEVGPRPAAPVVSGFPWKQ